MWEKDNLIQNLLQNKINCFINSRVSIKSFGFLSYFEEDECSFDLYVCDNKNKLSITRWFDVFYTDSWKKIGKDIDLMDHDIFAIKSFLSRLGFFFKINKNIKTNKDLFLIYYAIQLTHNSFLEREHEELKNFYLRFFLFELMLSDDIYNKFIIKNKSIFFIKENKEIVSLNKIISLIFKNTSNIKKKYILLIKYLESFFYSSIEFFFENRANILSIDSETNSELMYASKFISSYKKDKKIIFSAIKDGIDVFQSTNEIFISNIIFMNYSSIILRKQPTKIYQLYKFLNNDTIFSKIISSLVWRGTFIHSENYINTPFENYIQPINMDEIMLYNLTYAINWERAIVNVF